VLSGPTLLEMCFKRAQMLDTISPLDRPLTEALIDLSVKIERRRRVGANGIRGKPVKHASQYAYNHHRCRCPACTEAHRVAERNRRERRRAERG
jgi:hypothetical protein